MPPIVSSPVPSSARVRARSRPVNRPLAAAVTGLLALALLVVPAGTVAGAAGAPELTQAAAGPSTAGSIVFVRDHDIWVARGDGTSATRVTRDGTSAEPYRYPSMSDGGVVATVRDDAIVLLKQNGTVLRRIPVPKGHLYLNNGAGSFAVTGPVDAEISPDGSKVAYHQIRFESVGSRADVRTGFTDTTGLSSVDKYGIVLGDEFAWLTNSRGVLIDGNIHLYQLGRGNETQLWFNQGDVTEDYGDTPGYPQVSRDGRLVAWTSYTTGRILLARVTGDVRTSVPGAPTGLCGIGSDDGALEHPSFSPDASTLLWQEPGDELHVGWDFEVSAECGSARTKRLLANATQPDWSPAKFDVTPDRVRPTPGTPAPGTPSKPGRTAKQVLKLQKRPVVRGQARVGRTLRATRGTWRGKPSRYVFRWFRGARPIKGKVGAKRAYVVRRVDRGRRLSVRVTVRKAGVRGVNVARSKPVRVR